MTILYELMAQLPWYSLISRTFMQSSTFSDDLDIVCLPVSVSLCCLAKVDNMKCQNVSVCIRIHMFLNAYE